jgi:GH25 family lysozyme M1 (1,4-beta-N-acetylmuramidase)
LRPHRGPSGLPPTPTRESDEAEEVQALEEALDVLTGIDISSYQGSVDFSAVRASGHSFVIVKSTEGVGYLSDFHRGQVDGARANGLLVGHYHFARPDRGNDALDEAKYFLAQTDIRPGELVVLDVEAGGGNISPWVLRWLNYVWQQTGTRPFVYTGGWFIPGRLLDPALAAFPLWDAQYSGGLTFPSGVGPWAGHQVVVWQHSSSARVPGIGGNVDENYFNGPIEQLRAYGMAGSSASVVIPSTGGQENEVDTNTAARGLIYATRAGLLGEDAGTPQPNNEGESGAIEADVAKVAADVEGGLSNVIAQCERDGRYIPGRVAHLEAWAAALKLPTSGVALPIDLTELTAKVDTLTERLDALITALAHLGA